MNDLERLLAIVSGLDPDKREKEEDPPTDEELGQARTGLHEALKAAGEGDNPDLDAMRTIKAAIDTIESEVVTRDEARKAARTEADELLKSVAAQEGNGDEGDAEGDKDDEGDGTKDDDKDGEGDKDVNVDTKQSVAASIDLATAIGRGTKRKAAQAVEVAPQSDVILAALGPAQGSGISQDATIDDVADLFNKFSPQVKRGSAVLLHLERQYPDDRALGTSAAENTRMIDAVTSPRAITAAGGICEPLPADFAHPFCGDRGRPIFNANPIFRADRGGLRFAPSVTVADLESAITVWTNETDETPGSDTKACPRVDCEDEITAKVDAIVACLTVGNFQARFNPEFWRSRLDLLMVAHDRIAEQTLYATMLADPVTTTTLVPTGAGDGTVTDLLRVVDMQVAGIRDRHRLIGTRFFSILPASLQNALRTQLANQAPAGSADLFAVADAQIANFFAVRNVTPVWSPDIELIGAQAGAAALAAYNTPFNVLTYPAGTFLFLDGGTLDLGTSITDSTLNAVNDRQAFMETFEQVIGRGCEALVTPVAIAADCICA